MTRYFILRPYPDYQNKPRIYTELTEEQYFEMGGTKQCRSCNGEYPLDEYYNLRSSPDGKHPDCKQCCKVSRALEAVRKRDKKSKISVRQRVRAMNLGVLVHRDILLVEVFRSARGICYLCEQWVQPRHASMDHKHPLSKGGKHEHDNVALTHYKCNLRKGASIRVHKL